MSIQQGSGDTAGDDDEPMTKNDYDITNDNNNDSNITSWLNTIQKTAEQLDVKVREIISTATYVTFGFVLF